MNIIRINRNLNKNTTNFPLLSDTRTAFALPLVSGWIKSSPKKLHFNNENKIKYDTTQLQQALTLKIENSRQPLRDQWQRLANTEIRYVS